jgi:hypothetical protein
MEGLADAAVLAERPRQRRVVAAALEGVHELVRAHRTELE